MIKKIAVSLILITSAWTAGAADKNFTPLPGDGTTREWCDVASSADEDAETLRSRIERYNANDRCLFYIFFLYRHKTIHLTSPLTLEKNLNDRGGGYLTGTYISGYGPGGEEDLLDITLDVTAANKDDKCGIVLKGGFSALQQIHGFSILAKSDDKIVCDENGDDLYNAVSPNCEGGMKGKNCDFKGLKVFTTESPQDNDSDGDGVTDSNDDCSETEPGTQVNTHGCPDQDGDGVADDADACPDRFGPAENFGCPPCPDKNQDGRCDEAPPKDDSMEDPDEDGLTNALEEKLGTNPKIADSDGDGANDGADCAPLDAEQQSCAAPLTPGGTSGGETTGSGTTGGGETTGGSTGGTASESPPSPAAAAVQGCGCRMDGGSSSSTEALPFLTLTVGALLLGCRRRSHA